MLRITDYDRNNNYRKLNNDEMLFHNCIKYVLKGEKRFHVEGKTGHFDLIYIDNDLKAKSDSSFPDSDFYRSEIIFPPYYFYDENDLTKINLDVFDNYDEIFFEEVNEYSIVLAKIISKHTKLNITFADNNIHLFPYLSNINHSIKPISDNHIYVQSNFYPIYTSSNHFDTIGLFHYVFMLQWMSDLPIDQIKYLSYSIRKTEGIGSIMSTYSKLSKAVKKYNFQVFIEPNCTRFSEELMSKYFSFGAVPSDSNETNTIYLNCFNTLFLNYFTDQYNADISLDMLDKDFVKHMKEYADRVIADKKVLGVLLRGTDYLLNNFAGNYHPVSIEDCIDIINKKVDEDHYDKIFVATEDSYFLEKMIEVFPQKVLAVSQVRHNVSEFQDLKYISDLEKKQYSGDAYYASVEDTTVNYFYAMYMLSKCESFLSNCMCSGVNIVTSFNNGKFIKNEIANDILNKNED